MRAVRNPDIFRNRDSEDEEAVSLQNCRCYAQQLSDERAAVVTVTSGA